MCGFYWLIFLVLSLTSCHVHATAVWGYDSVNENNTSTSFPYSPSGCTFWGKKPWSQTRKVLWQVGMLLGAPVVISLIAGIAIPVIIVGIPIYMGRKVKTALFNSKWAAMSVLTVEKWIQWAFNSSSRVKRQGHATGCMLIIRKVLLNAYM